MSLLNQLLKISYGQFLQSIFVACVLCAAAPFAGAAQQVQSTDGLTADELKLLKTARNLHNQSRHHYDWGRYDSALASIRKAKEIIEELKGPEDPLILTFLNDMAYYYRAKGELGPVQALLEEVRDKRELINGEGSVDALLAAQALAEYLRERRLYQDALSIYEEVAAGFDLHEPSDATTFYRSRIARLLGNALALAGRLDDAEVALNRALEMAANFFGESSPKTRPFLSDLAHFYNEHRGDYSRSEQLYKRLLVIVEADTQWPEHVWSTKQSLGMLYLRSGEYELSEALLHERYVGQRSDGILEELNSPKLVVSASNLGEVYWAQGKLDRAVEYWKESVDRSARFENSILAVGTEVERLEYAAALVENINATLSLHLFGAKASELATEMALMRVLRTKGRVLEAQANTFRLVNDENATMFLKEQFTTLNELRGQHAFLSLSESDPERLSSIGEAIQGLERELAEHSANFVDIAAIVELEDVRAGIPEDAALVEFVRFQPYDVKGHRYGDWHYAAYVLTKTGQPTGVDLGAAAIIESNIAKLRESLTSHGEYAALAATLYAQLVAPWIEKPGVKSQLLVAPDGLLNLLPFECLQPLGGKALLETHRISYLSSGRRLAETKTQKSEGEELRAVVLSAPEYGTPSEDSNERLSGRFEGLEWTPLPGTNREAQAIASMLKDAELLTGTAATETALEELIAPDILHLATHGFFLGAQSGALDANSRGLTIIGANPKDELVGALEQMENPLLLSGLVLAGANRPSDEQDDGYMTALEMSGLDLQGTLLVVMSACETGVGKVTSGQGVFGLRRAVALAGASSQVMSLWKVSDDATTELMRVFYEGLTSGLSRLDALRNAQRAMSVTEKWKHPYFWAAFILSGDWREL